MIVETKPAVSRRAPPCSQPSRLPGCVLVAPVKPRKAYSWPLGRSRVCRYAAKVLIRAPLPPRLPLQRLLCAGVPLPGSLVVAHACLLALRRCSWRRPWLALVAAYVLPSRRALCLRDRSGGPPPVLRSNASAWRNSRRRPWCAGDARWGRAGSGLSGPCVWRGAL
jgi:hypothetical protein